MKRKALLLLFAAISVFAVRAQAVPTEAIVSFTGFDFVSPNTPTTPFLMPGDSYFAVGLATSFGPTISGAINAADEHSFYLQDAVVGTTAWDGTNLVVNFNPAARIRFYEDPSHDYAYGTNPPNGTSPSTFTRPTLRWSTLTTRSSLWSPLKSASANASKLVLTDRFGSFR